MDIFPKEVLICGQIFGCLPLVYSKSTKGRSSLVFSWKVHAWSIVVVSVLTVMSYYAIYADYIGFTSGKPIRMKNVTNALATILDVLPLNIMMLTVFFSNYKKRRIFIRIHRLLSQIDQKIHIGKQSEKVKFIVISCYSSFNLVFAAYSMIADNLYFSLYIPFWMTYLVQASVFLNFTCVMNIIEHSFKKLNEKIKLTVTNQHFNMNLLLKDLGLPKVEHTGDGPDCNMKELMECYSQLYEVVELTNQFFSSQLFTAIVSSFVHNLITLYFFFAGFISGETLNEILAQAMWVFTHSVHLVLLVWPCTSVSNAAAETASMVCQLVSKDIQPQLKQQLELFLLQLLHYKVEFSAVGFFNIDTQILTSIASSVTTYLVIMIQYRISEAD